jgi:hypothetical protein
MRAYEEHEQRADQKSETPEVSDTSSREDGAGLSVVACRVGVV